MIMSNRFTLATRLNNIMKDGVHYDLFLSIDKDLSTLYSYRGISKGYADFALLMLEQKSRFKLHPNAKIFISCDYNEILILDCHARKDGVRIV